MRVLPSAADLHGGSLFRARACAALRSNFKTADALSMVNQQLGALNWLLVDSTMKLIEAGGGSIPEMVNFLPADGVAYALVRMGFGAGRFRRNHFLFVHWVAEDTPPFAKVKANAQKFPIKSAFGASTALEFFAVSKEEMGLAEVLAKMNKYLVVDSDGGKEKLDTVDPSAGITVEAFEEALKEDNQALAAEFGVSESPEEEAGGEEEEEEEVEEAMPVTDAVASVRSADEPYNWVLIGPRA